MFYSPSGELRNKLVARLAEKTGLSEDQANKFLEALSEVTSEEEPDEAWLQSNLRTHMVSIPLLEREDGTLEVDTSGYSALTPLAKPKPKRKPPAILPSTPSKPSRPPTRPPGAYPGPSVVIKVNDWLGESLHLGSGALQRLREAAQQPNSSARSKDSQRFSSGGLEKSEGK